MLLQLDVYYHLCLHHRIRLFLLVSHLPKRNMIN